MYNQSQLSKMRLGLLCQSVHTLDGVRPRGPVEPY